jgi:hypothetical protein
LDLIFLAKRGEVLCDDGERRFHAWVFEVEVEGALMPFEIAFSQRAFSRLWRAAQNRSRVV